MLRQTKALPFEPFVIDHLVDPRGRYQIDLDPQFPFAIKLFTFPAADSFPMTWHERLELFIPLAGSGRFRMGDCVLDFEADDVIVVDNLKLHGLLQFRGEQRRAMSITFTSDLIYNIGSPICDFLYMTPFHRQGAAAPPIILVADPVSKALHGVLDRLVTCYFSSSQGSYSRAGCKAYLLEALYHLASHFQADNIGHAEYLKQQERSRRLARLMDYLQQHYARKITVQQAASMVGMSESRFMVFFKRATGATFINYVTHVRLTNACQLLRETDLPMADVAARVGFPDQAYFDRKFKQYFRSSPRVMRAKLLQAGGE